MRIQVFSEYYALAMAGKVDFLSCPKHQEDFDIFKVKYALEHKEENDKIVLYCTNCGYEQIAGLQLYENIINKIKEIQNGNIS